jgi:glycosyltransferase involved in cell wall biosynthesis/GT2 family glycosyltransferase
MTADNLEAFAIKTGCFSPEFYLSSLLDKGIICPPESQSLFEHYLKTGFGLGLSPSPNVSVSACLARHPELRDSAERLLNHCIARLGAGDLSGIGRPPDGDPVKTIAFYLPQYHPIPENDAAWGKGFTEWTNVTRAQPLFRGHAQPFLPSELGFYDLRLPEILAEQSQLARSFGVSGFCFYYYWFEGRRVLHKPLDLYRSTPSIDFPFCLCWANENWTKRWDGLDDEVIVGQKHSPVSDYSFIYSILDMLADPRYIRVNGKPLLLVYRADLLSNPRETFDLWRQVSLLAGVGELYIAGVRFRTMTAARWGLDALVEFPPHHFPAPSLTRSERVSRDVVEGFSGDIRNFERGVDEIIARPASAEDAPLFPGVMPSWDNTARRGKAATVFKGGDPALLEYWLIDAYERAAKLPAGSPRLVFINAWNEWAEGACLEPSQVHGRNFLHAVKHAAAGSQNPNHPFKSLQAFVAALDADSRPAVLFVSHDGERGGAQYLLLRLIESLRARGDMRCAILMKGGGPLRAEFEALGPTFVIDDLASAGWPLVDATRFAVKRITARGNVHVALCNTVAAADVGEALASEGLSVAAYIHELPTSISMYGADAATKAMASVTRRIIAVSEAVRDGLSSGYQIPAGDIEVIHTGLREQKRDLLNRKALFERYGVPEAKHLVVGCGMVHARKGTDVFVQAAQAISTGDLKDSIFVWVGGDQESDQVRRWALHDAKRLGLGDRIFFLGQIGDALSFIKEADVLVLTSREDPYPLVVLEALEVGTPVVCFDGAGGAPELIRQGGGAVVPYLDVAALAQAAGEFLTDDEKRARAKAEGAALRSSLTWERYVERISDRLLSLSIHGESIRQGRRPPQQSVADDLCVVIPSYNHARYIEAAVDSVLAQSLRPREIRIIDDGSSDGSPELLRAMASEELGIHVTTRHNIGAHATINEAISATSCRYVAILNSDDRFHPLRFESMMPLLTGPDANHVAFSRIRFIDEENRPGRADWYDEGLAFLNSDMPLWLALFRRNVVMTTSNIVADREALMRLGAFRPYRYCHDIDFLLRAARSGLKIGFLDATLCDYRMHTANTISESAARLAIEEGYLVAEHLAVGDAELTPAQLSFLYDALREKSALGLALKFLGWEGLESGAFDYRTAYEDHAFNSRVHEARADTNLSVEAFAAAIRRAWPQQRVRAVG